MSTALATAPVTAPPATAPAATVTARVIPRMSAYRAIGEDVSHLTDIDEILASVGAEFTAYTAMGEVMCLDGQRRENDTLSVINGDNHEILGTHKPGYHPIQYRTVAEIALDIAGLAGNGGAIDTVGLMKDGAQFYAAIDLGLFTLDPGGVADKVSRFLLAFSSHNGTFPVSFVPRGHRLACMNEMPAIRQDLKKGYGFAAKHTKNMLDKLATAKGALGIADAAQVAFEAQANALFAMPASQVTLERTVNKLWTAGSSEKGKTQHAKRLEKCIDIYNGPTAAAGVGHNNWAVYNAIGEFLDHGRGTSRDKRAVASITPGNAVEKAKVRALRILSN